MLIKGQEESQVSGDDGSKSQIKPQSSYPQNGHYAHRKEQPLISSQVCQIYFAGLSICLYRNWMGEENVYKIVITQLDLYSIYFPDGWQNWGEWVCIRGWISVCSKTTGCVGQHTQPQKRLWVFRKLWIHRGLWLHGYIVTRSRNLLTWPQLSQPDVS